MTKKTYILAFSGGLDTSTIIPWLKDKEDADVIAFCADLGQESDPGKLEAWAYELGAKEFIFKDLKEEFVQDYFYPALMANATYQDDYLLGTALARPLIAKHLAEAAIKYNADAVIHGATGKGNDQIRFEKTLAYFCPNVDIMAPWKFWDFAGRSEIAAYLETKGFKVDETAKTYSIDTNILHNSVEGSELENPEQNYNPEQVFQWVAPPTKSKSEPMEFTLSFESGLPVAIDGDKLNPVEMMNKLNEVGAGYGIGICDLVEERVNGIKSRGIYETPAGTILYQALKCLKQIVWDRNMYAIAQQNSNTLGDLIYDGDWNTPSFKALNSFFTTANEMVTGEIGIKLWGNFVQITKRKSPYSLYSQEIVSFESDTHGLQKHSLGFSQTLCFKQKLFSEQANKFKG